LVAKYKMLPFHKLFTYSPWTDKTLMAIGVVMGILGGVVYPMMALIFGELIDIFDPHKTDEEVNELFVKLAMWIGILAGVLWIAGYVQYAFLQHMAERVSFDLRSRYLRALLRQETAFFEKRQVEAMPSQIADHFQAIGEGVGEKFGQAIYTGGMAIGGIVLAFTISWVYSLISLAYMPIFFMGFGVFGKKLKSS